MPESAPAFDSRGIARRILPLAAIIVLVGAAYLASGEVSLESLVGHRAALMISSYRTGCWPFSPTWDFILSPSHSRCREPYF
jgi:hypothetical protein